MQQRTMQQRKATEGTITPGRKRVGGYVLGDTIGEGSFAKVRVGTHIMTHEKVAIKIIDKKLIAKRDYVRKNLRREAAMLQKLNHVNIAQLYEVLETQNNYYLVMELAEGGEFMRYLCDRRKLSERETRKYMRQLVSAVEYMHKAELVHRDIKIENFLLDEDNNLKVIDFGLSNVLGSDGFLRTQCGSPAYAAPEIFCSTSYGPAVDVWSIGVNMYAMLTGELPFTVDSPTNMTKLHAKIIKGCNIPEYLTKDCKDLLSRLLKADEAVRIKLGDVMKHTWINRGYSHRLRSCCYPNKLTEDHLNKNVVSYIAELDFTKKEVTENVIENNPTPDHAMYHLLVKRLANGWGYPEKPATHMQYVDSFISSNTSGPILQLTNNSRHKIFTRRSSGSVKTKVDDKNEINKKSNEIKRNAIGPICDNKQISAKLTKNYDRTSDDQKETPTGQSVEDMTKFLKKIDLNNNKNENNNDSKVSKRVKEMAIDKPKPIISTTCQSKSTDRTSGAQPRHITDTDRYGESVRLSESFSENLSHSCATRQCLCRTVPYFQRTTFKPSRLQRSASHASSVPLSSNNEDQNCFVNSKLAHKKYGMMPEGVSLRYRTRAKTFTAAESSLTFPKEGRLRRSKTEPVILYNFGRNQESPQLSDLHRKSAYPVQKHSSLYQKPSNTISGAMFGFPTRLRSSASDRLARLDTNGLFFGTPKQNSRVCLNPCNTLMHQRGNPKEEAHRMPCVLPSIQ
ncbi:serine/threonine-protein kinase par-1-like [Anneissia japonica]|uniref:serine/threonine-protein kinase par-1-like n=1 Tax=Anneissia japonica TaxID=1529436 RepID=UPI0014254E14|nr:serine/threonine-protein kinase par-1-like [Anneissia japonica]